MCNNRQIMYGSIPPVTIPPGRTPGDLPFFSYWAVYSSPLGTQKETIPHPGTLYWSHTALTHKRETTPLFEYKVKITIYFCAKPYHKHTNLTIAQEFLPLKDTIILAGSVKNAITIYDDVLC